MATGDAAAAKGLRVVPATKDLKLGYDDINARGDELAAEIDARANAVNTLAIGKLEASRIKVQNTQPSGPAVGDLWFADA